MYLLVVVFITTMYSCSSDDNNDPNDNGQEQGQGEKDAQLIGKWNFHDIRIDVKASDKVLAAVKADQESIIKRCESRKCYLRFTEDKFTDTYEEWEDIDYYSKNGYIYIWEDEDWKYSIKGNVFTFEMDETGEYARNFPNEKVEKVIFYWEYTK